MKRTYFCSIHQHKARPYISALISAGYRRVGEISHCGFLLIDFVERGVFSGTGCSTRQEVLKAEKLGKPIFMYPHSVRPNIPFDLIDEPYANLSAFFTIAEGHAMVLRKIEYPCPVEVAGWPYTPIRPSKPVPPKQIYNVLFAPLHPVGDGELPEIDQKLNAAVFRRLLDLGHRIHLTVRHIQDLRSNGLWIEEGVKYVPAKPDGATVDIEQADIVVAAYTFAYMAVALGKPLIMMGECTPSHNTPQKGGALIYARHWQQTKDIMRYPYNIEEAIDSDTLYDMLKSAAQPSQAVEDWKTLFIGQPFSPEKFIMTLEENLGYARSLA